MTNLWKKAVNSAPAIEEASNSHLEIKSALKKVDFKVKFVLNVNFSINILLFQPTTNRTRFKDISRGLGRKDKKKPQQRPTIIQNARKKNLAYYDRDIYNVLKLRKQIVVSCHHDHLNCLATRNIFLPSFTHNKHFRLHTMVRMQHLIH